MSQVATKVARLADVSKAAKIIADAVGDLSGVSVLGPRVLVGVYERGEGGEDVKTAGGIIVPFVKGGTLDEDKFQGKVCLVLKVGALAFNEGYASTPDHGDTVAVGDWIVLRPTDGFAMIRGGITCRLIKDADILMKVPSPDSVW